ncbi:MULTISPECIES: chromate transporter [Comamonas]|uniref:Chromate transporter, chromate ion transporter (CHR) family n=1 Tax=Comamonas testosteroni TaxID=285 RepID=A0A8B4S5X2_COMTE|nr:MULTISPECIES: chromate transporter [Comamonas]EHN64717.1 Chromate transporter [Comamonas testosteroni ATCC 11996]QQN68344.1 chromate transporter [Comamonas testosteroni]RDI10913.1 chromate transporter [Comamonas sp. AG1104]SUY78401.1 chromate transporter, chromate ion transporter (CHR) family [Comamonas testosteroni]
MSSPAPPSLPQAERPRPRHLRELFWSLTFLALQGFGGVLAVVQRELVEKRQWLSNEEFMEDWAVAQIMPGPNVVNLSIMLGERYFGWRGAIVGLCGMLTFPMLVVISLTLVYTQFATNPAVAGALRGMGAVAAGLVAGMGLKLAGTLRKHPLGKWYCAGLAIAAFVLVAVLRLPLFWALLLVGATGCVLTYRRLA